MELNYKFVSHSILPTVFQHYKDHGFHIVIIQLNKKHTIPIVEILTSKKLEEYVKDPDWLITHVEEFEDIPKEIRHDLARNL